MSRFEQLQAKYSESTSSNLRHWTELHQTIRDLRKGFCEFLGVQPETTVQISGVSTPVVSIGNRDDRHDFVNWQIEKLPKVGRAIEFSLKLAFGEMTQSEPAPTFVERMLIERVDGDLFKITLRNPSETEFKGPEFTQLFESIYQSAMESLKV